MLSRVARPVFALSLRASNCIENGLKIASCSNLLKHHKVRRQHTANVSGVEVPPVSKYLKAKIQSAVSSTDNEVITVQFEGQNPLSFPVIWLKDNCQCTHCFDAVAKSRVIDQLTFRIDSKPKSVEVNENLLKITWDDGHKSEYSKEWLCQHSFEEPHQKERQSRFLEARVPWNAEEFQKIFRKFSFDKVMNDEETLLQWLTALARHGVALVDNAPGDEGTVKRLTERVAFVRTTLYGEIFCIKDRKVAKNVTFKKGKLQLHSDLPYYRNLPGSLFLHCIIQSEKGGENVLTDGLNAAKLLTKEEYKLLAQTLVNWSDFGADGSHQINMFHREPLISEDKIGNIEKVNWSQAQRHSTIDVPINKATAWYKTKQKFTEILHNPKNAVIVKTSPGEILTIDNRRILHSRENYSDDDREVHGAFLDWDEIYSKIRTLRSKLNQQ